MTDPYSALEDDYQAMRKARGFNNHVNRKLADIDDEDELAELEQQIRELDKEVSELLEAQRRRSS